ncbi:hypothetical protein [Massilia endophytica]|uniref:hypothetical protein n=1 Tax=Massilia endophytica TaxID=2899220 RepID=UPI001E56ECB4|nr:hypothetical protein [Massilia endophytica]UGQ44571.1 hypothetical protein LSQ66_12190 [Massilia endophytica]
MLSELGTAGRFLVFVGAGAVLAFLPMILFPLAWARCVGWRVGPQTDLSVYYGRCLGCVSTLLGLAGLYAAFKPVLHAFFFALSSACFGSMVLVHLYGGWRSVQPRQETIEAAFWLALFILSCYFWPSP